MKSILPYTLLAFFLILTSCGGNTNGPGGPVGPFLFTVGQTSDNLFSFKGSGTGAISAISSASTGHAPSALVMQSIDISRQILYVVNSSSNNMTVLALDSTTGMVSTTGITVPVGPDPVAIGLRGASGVGTPTGPQDFGALYVLNQGSSSVSGFRITDQAGHMSEVPGSPFHTQTNAQALAVVTGGSSPANIATFVYVASGVLGNISGFKVNADGSLTELTGSPFPAGGDLTALASRAGGGVLLAADAANNRVFGFKIQDTGALTPFPASPFAAGFQPVAITFAFNDFVYVANLGGGNVSAYKFDFTNSTLTPIAGSPFTAGTNPVALGTARPLQLYVANQGSSDITGFNIDQNTGALTQISGSPFHLPAPPSALQTLFFMNVD
jgi:6-phosphogluconolactonase